MKQNRVMKTMQNFSGVTALPLAGGRVNLFPAADEGGAQNNIDRCIAFMEKNVNRPLQVAVLAAQASLSPSHFFAMFKQRTGCPPMDYFTRLRMLRACEIFDTTPASVKEVAGMMGYDDPFYFSRVFKSVSEMAPVHYRNLPAGQRAAIRERIEEGLNECLLSGGSLRRAENLAVS
jgi:transcriptional regulator GlxA family with amidase domain